MLKVDVAYVRTRTVISKRPGIASGGIAVEDSRKRHGDVCRAPQAWLAVALAQHPYLSHKIKGF
jgi:hypothetical protein